MTYSTEVQQASQILGILQTLEEKIREIRIEMAGKGEPSDGVYKRIEGGPIVTFSMKMDEYLGQIARIEEEWKEDLPLIEELRNLQDRKERASLDGAAV